jgi:serine/threonine protein kinase
MGQKIACLWRRSIYLEGSETHARVGRQLAEGGFSFVHICFDSKGVPRALKRIKTPVMEARQAALRELDVHRKLTGERHPNLLPLLDWGRHGQGSPREEVYLMFPLWREGTLRDAVNRRVLDRTAPPGTLRAWPRCSKASAMACRLCMTRTGRTST